MMFLGLTKNCVDITRFILKRSNTVLQTRAIYSLTNKWDEKYVTAETLHKLESHWKQVFNAQQETQCTEEPIGERGKKYILAMFPYPSGNLHMGHVRVYTVSDTLARYYRARGFKVIHPMGWDAFGLPAENAAIERGLAPADWTDTNIRLMKEQFQLMGCQFDWWREVRTCSPNYYRWTQDIFLRLFSRGLTCRRQAAVNWDPVDKTVLAAEQVDNEGRAWRSGALVERRLLHQWYILTTKFSESLYSGLSSPQLKEWKRRNVDSRQKGWIGYCTGHTIQFTVAGGESSRVGVYVSHPELLCGVSFIGVRSDHFLAAIDGVLGRSSSYTSTTPTTSTTTTSTTSTASGTTNEVTNSQRHPHQLPACRLLSKSFVNPITGKHIPILVSDDIPYSGSKTDFYLGYGSGSEIDADICKKYNFDVVNVLEDNFSILDYINQSEIRDPDSQTAQEIKNEVDNLNSRNNNKTINNNNNSSSSSSRHSEPSCPSPKLVASDVLSGLPALQARDVALRHLEQSGADPYPSSNRQKDWLISRQRQWGTPIPLVHCPQCGVVPVPRDQLPVVLPASPDQREQWKTCACYKCGGVAERETDTMDTFVDSSWYFLRYLDPSNTQKPFESSKADSAMPVDIYVGGEEHAVRHLYYARFVQQFLHSEGLSCHSEPFLKLMLVGRINAPAYVTQEGKYLHKEGVDLSVTPPVDKETGQPVKVLVEKMSKSKHNGIDPLAVVSNYGTDVTRVAMLRGETAFNNRSWHEESVGPVNKLMNSVWRIVGQFVTVMQSDDTAGDIEPYDDAAVAAMRRARNCVVHDVNSDYENSSLNFVVRNLETFTHNIRSAPMGIMRHVEYEKSLAALLVMLAPMAPHITAELWQAFADHVAHIETQEGSVHSQSWPRVDHGFKRPIKLFVSVNDRKVYFSEEEASEASIVERLAASLMTSDDATCKDELVTYLVAHVPNVMNCVAGQPVIRSIATSNRKALALEMYTLDERALRLQKKLYKKAARVAAQK